MFQSESELDEELSSPSTALVESMRALRGDLVVLGAGGKMGASLCMLARRALDAAGRNDRVIAVSRWSDRQAAKALDAAGIEVHTADLVEDPHLSILPDAANVVFMLGSKFGSGANPATPWIVNAVVPDRVARRYSESRVVAFSTGNVYPFVPISSGGATEDVAPSPVGDYAMSALGRERVFEYWSLNAGIPVTILRLNYALDLRYGVLADIASSVYAGEAVQRDAGAFNVVWQGYANEVALRALEHATSPAFVLNITGPEILLVKEVASRFGELFDVPVTFTGTSSTVSLLNDASLCHELFGLPSVSAGQLIEWQADWVRRALPTLGRPTKFSVRDGRF